MIIHNEEHIFNGPVRFNLIPKELPQRFVATDTTPSVRNNKVWIANNGGAVTVTDFDEGAEGQEINVKGDGFTTVANNANIKTSTGANKLLAANTLYTFIHIEGVWYEQI